MFIASEQLRLARGPRRLWVLRDRSLLDRHNSTEYSGRSSTSPQMGSLSNRPGESPMTKIATTESDYVMGHNDRERHRLSAQAAILAPITEQLLRRAGVGSG